MQLDASFFAMDAPPAFAATEVIKRLEIAADLARFDAHMANTLVEMTYVAA